MEGTFRCSRLDAGNQPNKPVVASLQAGTAEQRCLDDPFGYKPLYRPSETLDRPACGITLVDDTHNVAPRLERAHAANGWQPGVELGQHTVQISGVAAGLYLADGSRVASAQAGIAADPASGTGGAEAGLGAFGDQRPLKLGHRAEHLKGEHALRRAGIDGIAQAAKMSTACLQLIDHGQQMTDRTGKPIKPDDDQGFARPDFAQEPGQYGPAAVGAGRAFLHDDVAAGRQEFVKLRIGALFLR